jgi:hypothetical protein
MKNKIFGFQKSLKIPKAGPDLPIGIVGHWPRAHGMYIYISLPYFILFSSFYYRAYIRGPPENYPMNILCNEIPGVHLKQGYMLACWVTN